MPNSKILQPPPPSISGELPTPPTSTNINSATRHIKSILAKSPSAGSSKVWNTSLFDAVPLAGLRPISISGGHVLCSYTVQSSVADLEGKWHAGAMATAMDDIGIAAIIAADGEFRITVDFAISVFSTAEIGDEMEIEAKLVERRGKLGMVVVVVRRRGTGGLVAASRQWVSILPSFHRSNM